MSDSSPRFARFPGSPPQGDPGLNILAHHAELLRTLAPGLIHQVANAGQGVIAARTSPVALEAVARRLSDLQEVLSSLTQDLGVDDRADAPVATCIDRILAETELWQGMQLGLPHARIVFEARPPLLSARIRPGHLRDALVAIVTNAKEAMAGQDSPEVRVAVTARGGRTVITVADAGPGFAPEALDRLFEPFNTTKDRSRHLGLGLAVARELVRRADGEIRVLVSEHAPRTRVELDLPA
jgi:C4-dicarboxylate-specific signal transduction histidine kinase